MQQKIGVKSHRLVAQGCDRGVSRTERRRVTRCTSDVAKKMSAPGNRLGAARSIRRSRRRRQITHEGRELFDAANGIDTRLAVGIRQVESRRIARRKGDRALAEL